MRPLTSVAALALAATLLAGCGDDTEPTSSETGSDPASTPAPSEPASDPTEPTGDPGEATSDPAAGTVAAPIYFTGETPLGERLYREFRQVESDNPLEEAAALLLAGDAEDPDYGTLLTGVTIGSITQDDDAIVVTLAEDSVLTADKGMSPKDAEAAVQSLVYTLQGVAQERLPVQVRLADGTPTDLFDQPTSTGVEAAPELDVLSLVSLTTPAEGATVNGTVTVEGVASSFEATVPVVVLDESGTQVVDGFATAEGFVDKLYPFTTELDLGGLAPGTYTLVARTDDPSGGEGPGPFEDTRTIVVG